MNQTSAPSVAPSEALLREIERQTLDEIRTVEEAAEREGQAIVAHAHASARRRMHDAIEDLRAERRRSLARAMAKLETEARVRSQQRAVAAIRQAWPFLVEALHARWMDPAARSVWEQGVARHACDRLMPGSWTVEHPAAWRADEQRRFRDALAVGSGIVNFVIDGEITAGLRIRANQATLDATPQALLADRAAVEALLLAEIGPDS